MNTYLFKGDFVPPEVTGRYVVAPNGIPAGAMLRPKDVALQPIMPTSLPPGGYFSIHVSPVEIANGLNAGSTAQVCAKGGVSLATGTVRVVRCDPSAPGVSCSALIEVTDKAAADLAAKGLRDPDKAKELTLAQGCKQ